MDPVNVVDSRQVDTEVVHQCVSSLSCHLFPQLLLSSRGNYLQVFGTRFMVVNRVLLKIEVTKIAPGAVLVYSVFISYGVCLDSGL